MSSTGRALGTCERFSAFLIEHFGGAFPTWLAPVQVGVIAVSEKFNDYGEKLVSSLTGELVRAELDRSGESLGKKIRTAARRKIPNVLIVGENECNSHSVTWRRYGKEEAEHTQV